MDEETLREFMAMREETWRRIAGPVFAEAHKDSLAEDQRLMLEEWEKDVSRNVIIVGPVGVGKTHMAYTFMRQAFMTPGVSTVCSNAVSLLESAKPDADRTLWTNAFNKDVLLIDDLGSHYATEWASTRMFELCDHRWSRGLSTVVTSNWLPENLKKLVGERVYDRLRDRALTYAFPEQESRRETAKWKRTSSRK